MGLCKSLGAHVFNHKVDKAGFYAWISCHGAQVGLGLVNKEGWSKHMHLPQTHLWQVLIWDHDVRWPPQPFYN